MKCTNISQLVQMLLETFFFGKYLIRYAGIALEMCAEAQVGLQVM
jgi:hypothetical protein